MFVSVFVSVFLPACAYRSGPPITTQASILPVPDTGEIPDAIKDLLSQADQKYMQGDYEGSIATLERAIRINPRYPEIWTRIAQVYTTLGETRKAVSYAQRSNAYIDNNPELKILNDDIIRSGATPQEGGAP